MYHGGANSAVDDKGRILMPAPMRAEMVHLDHEILYLTAGFDGCIFVLPAELYKGLCARVSEAGALDPDLMDFNRFFTGMAAKAKLDPQGRLAVPATLRDYAGLKEEAVLLGVRDHLQLWSKEGWQAFCEREAQNYKAMAKRLFGGWPGAPRPSTGGDHGSEDRSA